MPEVRPRRRYDYVTDPAEIYRRSFAEIRATADLSGLPEDARTVAVRMIHACGMVDLVDDIGFSGGVVTAAVLVAGQARTASPASQAYLDQALPEGGGSNVVNVVLVDFRGFDTLGEITVLAVAALGIGSLVGAGRRSRPTRTRAPVAEPLEDAR